MTCIDCCYALLKDGDIICTYEDGNCIITDRMKRLEEQLIKAKKVINSLLPFEHVIDPYALASDIEENQKRFHEPFRRAEQFLKEV